MTNLFFEKQRMDLRELNTHLSTIMSIEYTPPKFDSITNTLKRAITTSEIIKYLRSYDDNLESLLRIADLKYAYTILDAKYMIDRGFQTLYYKDLAPGSTTIVYEIYTTRYE